MILIDEPGGGAMFSRFLVWLIKWLSGFIFSFIIAVFGFSIFNYGVFSFLFALTAGQIFFWRWFHKCGLISILVFDALVVFLLFMFRLYIVLGPNI